MTAVAIGTGIVIAAVAAFALIGSFGNWQRNQNFTPGPNSGGTDPGGPNFGCGDCGGGDV